MYLLKKSKQNRYNGNIMCVRLYVPARLMLLNPHQEHACSCTHYFFPYWLNTMSTLWLSEDTVDQMSGYSRVGYRPMRFSSDTQTHENLDNCCGNLKNVCTSHTDLDETYKIAKCIVRMQNHVGWYQLFWFIRFAECGKCHTTLLSSCPKRVQFFVLLNLNKAPLFIL